jgi:hypothetical protein
MTFTVHVEGSLGPVNRGILLRIARAAERAELQDLHLTLDADGRVCSAFTLRREMAEDAVLAGMRVFEEMLRRLGSALPTIHSVRAEARPEAA